MLSNSLAKGFGVWTMHKTRLKCPHTGPLGWLWGIYEVLIERRMLSKLNFKKLSWTTVVPDTFSLDLFTLFPLSRMGRIHAEALARAGPLQMLGPPPINLLGCSGWAHEDRHWSIVIRHW